MNLLPNNEILQAENLFLRQQLDVLREENARLKEVAARLVEEVARLKKDSSTSSKPPSTDLLKPPPPRRSGGKRRRGGLLGPRMTAMIAFLKGGCHASYTIIERLFREVIVLTLARGTLAKAVAKTSRALAEPYEQLVQALPQAEVLGVDETGHHNAGRLHWTWCLQTPQFSLFHIDRSRGSRVLRKLLGRHFAGVLECDYYGAYRKYVRLTGGKAQFCLAHLYRDVRFLIGHPLAVLTRWGRRLLNLLRRVFKVWHQRPPDDPAGAVAGLRRIRDKFLTWVRQPPAHPLAKTLARRFRGDGAEHYFRFVEDPSLEPTNNATERALRWAVIDRKVMQATGSQAGMRWCERAWTTIQTCLKQGHNVMEYFHRAIEAHWRGQLAPALVKL